MPRRTLAVWLIAGFCTSIWACGSRTVPTLPVPPPQPDRPATPELPATPARETPSPPPEADPVACVLIAEAGDAVTTVALTDRIDPSNAPAATNDSERLLFRQIYETLLRIDCEGRVRPGLASSWRLDADGRTWIVTLRDSARFSDGTPVTPDDVRASWTRGAAELRPAVSRLVESIVPVDERNVAIRLKRPRADAPLVLAHTDLAIARHVSDSRWPLGTRAGGAVPERDGGDSPIALARDGVTSIRFLVATGDPRDLLDRGVDLMLTRDPAALAYAATLPHFRSVPLAWDRIHVLLAPGRARESPAMSDEARKGLAADAVRGEARGAAGPFWWQTLRDCTVTPDAPATGSTPRIVYDSRDGVARDLAERFVGLSRYERATGLTGDSLASARRRGTEAGYIVALDRHPIDPCRDIQVLADAARWIDPDAIVPLVETRLQAIVRRGKSGLVREGDGGLLIAGESGRDTR